MNSRAETTCLFTGHRELPEEQGALRLCVQNKMQELISAGVQTFLSGGARGFDLLGAALTVQLRRLNPQVRLIMVLPCPKQDREWGVSDRNRLAEILEQADEVILLEDHYYRGCMHRRNNYMVEHARHCIAYCSKDSGGSYYTLSRAQKQGLSVYNMADSSAPAIEQFTLEGYLG